jgi:transcriptional regulator with XRE-family HTH domain
MTRESQKALASRAGVTESVLKLLESPDRKQPDIEKLKKVKLALEAFGVTFLAATDHAGEGVRFSKPDKDRSTEMFLRHGRALLDLSIDEMASLSGVGRISIGRIERGKLTNPPEPAIGKIREVLFERGGSVLPEEETIGGGVRFRDSPFGRKTT